MIFIKKSVYLLAQIRQYIYIVDIQFVMNNNRTLSDLRQYYEIIEIAKRNGKFVNNRGREYATILLLNIFKEAKKELYILTENLSGRVSDYNGYKRELEKCITEKKCSVYILLEKQIDSESKTYSLLKRLYNSGDYSNLKIAKLNNSAINYLKSNFKDNVPNYCVTDNAYRVENAKEELLALGQFNLEQSNITKEYLKKHYKEAFRLSESIKQL